MISSLGKFCCGVGFETVASTPDEFSTRIRVEIPRWAKVIREAAIKVGG